ncbi:MAG: hypothetical protein HY774_14475 [Acidobacteria bacterium]|nr:hypothetical protein [Acidobacteriota bacterium]
MKEATDTLRKELSHSTGATVEVLKSDKADIQQISYPDDNQNAILDGHSIVVFVRNPETKQVVQRLSVNFPQINLLPDDLKNDVNFCTKLADVFNLDLVRCNCSEGDELWEILSESRTARAISRSVHQFSSRDVSQWLRLLESSMSLTYEGSSVRYTVFFATSLTDVMNRLGPENENLFVKFPNPLGIDDALLHQKWIRKAVDSQRVALVAIGNPKECETSKPGGYVVGLLAFSGLPEESPKVPYAPHQSLVRFQGFLGSDGVAMTVSPAGDLWLFANESLFVKSQGTWFYLSFHHAHTFLTKQQIGESIVTQILRVAIDLSFERKGALLCILDEDSEIGKMVSDHETETRANGELRDSLKNLSIHEWSSRQLITAAASVDGATILSKTGKLLDVGCLVSQPTTEKLKAVTGNTESKPFSGARSRAAWNASIFGIAVKISEDGPITIYHHGEQILCIGGKL